MWEAELQAGGKPMGQSTENKQTNKLNRQALVQGQLQAPQHITVHTYMTRHLLSTANM